MRPNCGLKLNGLVDRYILLLTTVYSCRSALDLLFGFIVLEKRVFTTLPSTFFSDRLIGLVYCEFSFSEIAESYVRFLGVIFFLLFGVNNFRCSCFTTGFFNCLAFTLFAKDRSGLSPIKSDLLRTCPYPLSLLTLLTGLIVGRFNS